MNITEMCLECKNFFLRERENSIHSGTFTISNGVIAPLDFLKVRQYFRIVGSDIGNDAVWEYTGNAIEGLKDETFTGAIWAMSVPKAFVDLCAEITEWQNKYGAVGSTNMSPYQSESISGVYSRTKASGGSSAGSGESSVETWQSVYKSRLNKWRRISIL
ncbi:MAG: hypothetical protein IJH64_00540 [Oscillospiraceae bacterium]|nr:hypothetical protein [Oscillospiraceae bacterium]